MSKRAKGKYSIGITQDPIVYYCKLCDYKTKSETGIRLHTVKTHEMKPDLDKKNVVGLCEFCKKTFKDLKETMKHIKLNHRQS